MKTVLSTLEIIQVLLFCALLTGITPYRGKVEAHKGTITAENRTNGGALFTIKIPTHISDMTNLLTENKI